MFDKYKISFFLFDAYDLTSNGNFYIIHKLYIIASKKDVIHLYTKMKELSTEKEQYYKENPTVAIKDEDCISFFLSNEKTKDSNIEKAYRVLEMHDGIVLPVLYMGKVNKIDDTKEEIIIEKKIEQTKVYEAIAEYFSSKTGHRKMTPLISIKQDEDFIFISIVPIMHVEDFIDCLDIYIKNTVEMETRRIMGLIDNIKEIYDLGVQTGIEMVKKDIEYIERYKDIKHIKLNT